MVAHEIRRRPIVGHRTGLDRRLLQMLVNFHALPKKLSNPIRSSHRSPSRPELRRDHQLDLAALPDFPHLVRALLGKSVHAAR